MAPDLRFLPVVSRARCLPERSGLLFPERFEQDGDGLSRIELVPTARATNHSRSAKHLRWHLDQGPKHGLDVRPTGGVSGRGGGGDFGTAARASGRLSSALNEQLRRRRASVLPRTAAIRYRYDSFGRAGLGELVQEVSRYSRI